MRLLFCLLLALSFGVPSAVSGACAPVAPAIGTTPIEARFLALIAQDRFHDVPGNVTRWQALIADAKRNSATSPELLARSYGWLAWSLDYLDKVDAALDAAREADRILREARLSASPFASDILSTLSMVETDTGKTEEGAARAAQALALARRHNIESAEGSFAHNAVAGSAYTRGHYEEAERDYAAATEIAVRCLPPGNAFIVNQMASHAGVLYMLGRSEDALAENERAANWALTNLSEDSPVVTLALGNLGVMLRSAGRYPEAEAALRRVVDLEARYQKDSYYYRAISLSNFASVIDRQGRHREAEALWLKSSEFHKLVTTKRDPVTPAYPLRFSADAAQARGDFTLALARRAEGLALVEKDAPKDHPEVARARIEYGLTLTLLKRAKEGLAVATPAIAVVQAKLAPDDVKRLTAEVDYARIVAAVSGPEAGYRIVLPIATRLEGKLLDSSTARGDLLRYGPIFSASFATVTEWALATHRDEAAFHWLQLANLSDIALVNADVAARAVMGTGAARDLMRRLQDRIRERQSLDRARTFAASSNQPAELARLDAAIRANDAVIARTSAELDTAYPAFRTLGRPVPTPLAAFRSKLSADQILVAPLPVDDGTLAIAVTRDGLKWQKTVTPRWVVADRVAGIRAAIDDARSSASARPAFATNAAAELYRAILPPALAPAFTAHSDMLYYSSGPLATLPPGLLVAPSRAQRAAPQWLVRTHSVTVLPTLRLREADAPSAQRVAFLGIGAPASLAGPQAADARAAFRGVSVDRVAIRNLPALPQASRELKNMAALLGGDSTLLLDTAATEAAVKALPLGRFGIIAIATHGLGGGDFAGLTEPALVLTLPSSATDKEDGLLTASEIAGLHLDADWVILSACNTASGLGAGTPAYSGLATAFMAAGAKALLVSHWPVRDDAAEALTVATLRGTRAGLSRARALQRAMVALLDDRAIPGAANPAIWAPFVLIER